MRTACPNCKKDLLIMKNIKANGSFDKVPIFCPICNYYVTEVLTNWFPIALAVDGNIINL